MVVQSIEKSVTETVVTNSQEPTSGELIPAYLEETSGENYVTLCSDEDNCSNIIDLEEGLEGALMGDVSVGGVIVQELTGEFIEKKPTNESVVAERITTVTEDKIDKNVAEIAICTSERKGSPTQSSPCSARSVDIDPASPGIEKDTVEHATLKVQWQFAYSISILTVHYSSEAIILGG